MKLSGKAPPAFSSRILVEPEDNNRSQFERELKLAAGIDFTTTHLKRKKNLICKTSPAFNYPHTDTIYSIVELDSKIL